MFKSTTVWAVREEVTAELLETVLAYKKIPKHKFIIKYTKLQKLLEVHRDFVGGDFDLSPEITSVSKLKCLMAYPNNGL